MTLTIFSKPSSLITSSDLKVEERKKILILAESGSGLGDLFFGLKLASIIRKISTLSVAILCLKDEDYKVIRELSGKKTTPLIFNQKTITDSWLHESCLYIGAATCVRRKFVNFPPIMSNGHIPFLGISEYDYDIPKEKRAFRHDQERSSGLGFYSLGIFINQDLRSYSINPFNQNKNYRLNFISDLSPVLQTMILDKFSLEAYKKTHSLYFGHCYGLVAFLNFIHTVVTKEASEEAEYIDVFVPGKKTDLCFDDFFIFFLKNYRSFLNISLLISVGISKVICEDLSIKLTKKGKTLRILNPSPITHQDFKVLIKASEPLMLATGDQSFSEACSAGKLIYYEQLEHKKVFFTKFRKILRENNVSLQLVNEFFFEEKQTKSNENIKHLLEEIQKTDVVLAYQRALAMICESFNIEKKLEELVVDLSNLYV